MSFQTIMKMACSEVGAATFNVTADSRDVYLVEEYLMWILYCHDLLFDCDAFKALSKKSKSSLG